VALDPFTTHGQDGLIDGAGYVQNDLTVETLVRQARSHADAGADVVAPSDMMDGRIAAIRDAFETAGLVTRGSSPTRPSTRRASTAVPGSRRFGGTAGRRRQAHLSDGPANSDEALREVALDISEGATW